MTVPEQSLSVKFPGKAVNPAKQSEQEPNKPLLMTPTFEVKQGSLPPLRLGIGYKVRCRAVDLAGNSLPSPPPPPSRQPDYQPVIGGSDDPGDLFRYRRWEPVCSPVMLATEKIDPRESPGEQMDRLVIRDGHGRSDRFLAPPRLPRHTVEMHGMFDQQGLVPGAFAHVLLLPDGSFPAFSDSDNAKVSDRNAYFRYDRSYNETPKCPYYPDPFVSQVRIRAWRLDSRGLRPDQPSFELWIPFFERSQWPDALPIRLRQTSVDGEVWDKGSTPPDPKWHWELLDENDNASRQGPAAEVALRRGEVIDVEISSVLPDRELEIGSKGEKVVVGSCLAIVNQVLRFAEIQASQSEALVKAFTSGTHRMVSPAHQLTLVHASKNPLLDLVFITEGDPRGKAFNIQRGTLNDPVADVSGDIQMDWFSTARIVCDAEWTDVIDDVSKPAPVEVQTKEQALEIKRTDLVKEGPPGIHECDPANTKHYFRDTKFHEVKYNLTAASRFRDYYPEREEDSKFQIRSEKSYTALVSNSKRPANPSVVYVIPAFRWQEDKEGKVRTHARTGALRVYLERPWFSSGNGELLGVVFSSASEPKKEVMDIVTQWGVDPIWGVDPDGEKKGEKLPGWTPQLGDFRGYKATAFGCFPAEFDDNPSSERRVDVVGYEVNYDENRQLWFSDIQLDPRKAYSPFVRLALVRFQPNSISPPIDSGHGKSAMYADARISQVVVSDFAQLTPNRWAHVQRIDHKNFKVTVSGVSYYSCLEGQVGPSHLRVAVQKRWDHVDEEFGWITKEEIGPEKFNVSTNDGVTTWEATIHITESTILHSYRLLIQEYEQLYADGYVASTTDPSKKWRDPNAPQPVERLVYADAFEL